MSNDSHLSILREGLLAWNSWRREHTQVVADLTGADLTGADLTGADLTGADLTGADLTGADLTGADLRRAILDGAIMDGTRLDHANLQRASLVRTSLRMAAIKGADLSGALLNETTLCGADLRGSRVYGVSVWNVDLEDAAQSDMILTKPDEPEIIIDNLEVAQLLYLITNNQKILELLGAITRRSVLILGRFLPSRLHILDIIRQSLRRRNYIPVVADFGKPTTRTLDETILTLALMSRFIIVDITSPRSQPLELSLVVPQVRVPILPLLEEGEQPFPMFRDLQRYPWVLTPISYQNAEQLIIHMDELLNELEAQASRIESLKASATTDIPENSQVV